MKSLLVLFALSACLCGCKTSTRSIELHEGSLLIEPASYRAGVAVYCLSRDGSRMVGYRKGGEDDEIVFEVLDAAAEGPLATYSSEDSEWVPLMFTDDGQSLVVARGDEGRAVTAVVAIGEPLPLHDRGQEGTGIPISSPNNDWSLWAGPGIVVTSAGAVVQVPDVAEDSLPYFDEFGNAWLRQKTGRWVRVDKRGRSQVLPRPAYLVSEPGLYRGSMRLVAKEDEHSFEHAVARLTVLWLHSDHARGGMDSNRRPRNRSALVHAGADVQWAAFVPGQDAVLVLDSGGTWTVPFRIVKD